MPDDRRIEFAPRWPGRRRRGLTKKSPYGVWGALMSRGRRDGQRQIPFDHGQRTAEAVCSRRYSATHCRNDDRYLSRESVTSAEAQDEMTTYRCSCLQSVRCLWFLCREPHDLTISFRT